MFSHGVSHIFVHFIQSRNHLIKWIWKQRNFSLPEIYASNLELEFPCAPNKIFAYDPHQRDKPLQLQMAPYASTQNQNPMSFEQLESAYPKRLPSFSIK